MSRRSGHRFADKDMRQRVNPEHIPIPQEWDVLWMRFRSFLMGSIAAGAIVGAALAQPFRIVEVASVADTPVGQIAPQTIAFSDHKQDNVTDRTSGLIKFDDWAQTRPVQKQFL